MNKHKPICVLSVNNPSTPEAFKHSTLPRPITPELYDLDSTDPALAESVCDDFDNTDPTPTEFARIDSYSMDVDSSTQISFLLDSNTACYPDMDPSHHQPLEQAVDLRASSHTNNVTQENFQDYAVMDICVAYPTITSEPIQRDKLPGFKPSNKRRRYKQEENQDSYSPEGSAMQSHLIDNSGPSSSQPYNVYNYLWSPANSTAASNIAVANCQQESSQDSPLTSSSENSHEHKLIFKKARFFPAEENQCVNSTNAYNRIRRP